MSQTRFKKRSQAVLVRRETAIALCACLILTLPACSTTKYVRELPSPELLAECPEPAIRVETNKQLAETVLAFINALTKCNIDKASLREWANDK